jgi:hypothetical protein
MLFARHYSVHRLICNSGSRSVSTGYLYTPVHSGDEGLTDDYEATSLFDVSIQLEVYDYFTFYHLFRTRW